MVRSWATGYAALSEDTKRGLFLRLEEGGKNSPARGCEREAVQKGCWLGQFRGSAVVMESGERCEEEVLVNRGPSGRKTTQGRR